MFHQEVSATTIKNIQLASEGKLAAIYRKSLLKVRKCNNHLWFNKQCIKEDVTPKFMKITCHNKSKEARETIEQSYKVWLKKEIQKWYTRRNNLKLHLKIIHMKLLQIIHPIVFDIIDREIREEVQERSFQHHRIQLKKLEDLKNRKLSLNVANIVPKNTHENNTYYPHFINLTEIHFTDLETKLLEKGLKYNPNITQNNDIKNSR